MVFGYDDRGCCIHNDDYNLRVTDMKLQDRLISLAEYGVGFNIHDGNVLVNITYKDGWSVIEPSDETITFMSDDKRPNTYYYSAPLTTDMSHIFEAIDETVTYNKELEEKITLFQGRVEEMQELFAKKPLSVLKTMKFVFEEPQPQKKKKATATTKKQPRKKKETERPLAMDITDLEPKVGDALNATAKLDDVIQLAINEKERETENIAI